MIINCVAEFLGLPSRSALEVCCQQAVVVRESLFQETSKEKKSNKVHTYLQENLLLISIVTSLSCVDLRFVFKWISSMIMRKQNNNFNINNPELE